MRVGLVGAGSLGARAGRQLVSVPGVDLLAVFDPNEDRRDQVSESLGPHARSVATAEAAMSNLDVVVLAGGGPQVAHAARALADGCHVIATSDDSDQVGALLGLAATALAAGRTLVVGAAMAPGLAGLLAGLGARKFDEVTEVHVARMGWAGPDCGDQWRRAQVGLCREWNGSGWTSHASGSGRRLIWFPEPLGARDCYRANLADTRLLVNAFPSAERVTARLAVTRVQRVNRQLGWACRPGLSTRTWSKPLSGARAAGESLGGVRVEVSGRPAPSSAPATGPDPAAPAQSDSSPPAGSGNPRLPNPEVRSLIYGVIDRPSVAAGGVAALAARWAADGRLPPGAYGLASLLDPGAFLAELAALGVKAARFDGPGGLGTAPAG
ncbi:MAG: Gfo/Idh/MocA family oxidoreductase [Acidimicrobiales bacterium]